MAEVAQHPGFIQEAVDLFRHVRKGGCKNFDRDTARQSRVGCAVHGGHAATAEHAVETVTADDLADACRQAFADAPLGRHGRRLHPLHEVAGSRARSDEAKDRVVRAAPQPAGHRSTGDVPRMHHTRTAKQLAYQPAAASLRQVWVVCALGFLTRVGLGRRLSPDRLSPRRVLRRIDVATTSARTGRRATTPPNPVASNNTKNGRAKNRRVRFEIVK